MRIRQLSLFGTLLLVGCGANVSVGDEGSPPSSPSSPIEPTPTEAALCASAGLDGAAALMTIAGERRAVIVHADASTLPLDVGTASAPNDWQGVSALGRAEHVATALSWIRVGSSSVHADSIVKLFDVTGRELARADLAGYEADVVGLASDGRALIYRYSFGDGTLSDHAVLSPSGELESLEGFIAEGWVAGDVIRGHVGDPPTPAFLDPDSGEIHMVAQAAGALWTRSFGDGFLALHPGKSAPWLFYVRPDGANLAVLWDVDSEPEQLDVIAAAPGHVLLRNNSDGRVWRIALADGEVLPVSLVPPLGPPLDAMSYCAPLPQLASDGSVVMVGGLDALTFQRVEPSDGSWATLGVPVTEVETVDARERDGTYLLHGAVGSYCPGPIGVPTDGALSGSSVQLVRPSSGAYQVLPIDPWISVSIRSGGACVAYGVEDSIHVLDVGGDEGVFESSGGFAWWAP